MGKKQMVLAAGIMLLGLVSAGLALASGEEISRYVMGGGGQTVEDAGNTFILRGTIAEPVAGNLDTVIGADYHIRSGFWGGEQATVTYLPVLLKGF